MRARLRFAKTGKVRFTSHRDVARMWERAFRRAEVRLAYSSGFSPRPKVSFGLALPTGYESVAEYLDVEMAGGGPDVSLLPGLLTPQLPAGIEVLAAAAVDDAAPSLQHDVTSCRWEIEAAEVTVGELSSLVDRALAAATLVVSRTRKGQEVVDDIRPAILSLAVLGPTDEGAELECELATQPRGLRPSELLDALGGVAVRRARRTHQWIERDGARVEPLPTGSPEATDAQHVLPALVGAAERAP